MTEDKKNKEVVLNYCNKELFNASKDLIFNKIKEIYHPILVKICKELLSNDKFLSFPASVNLHHVFMGGLLVHTAEVVDCACGIAKTQHFAVNMDVLISSAILHDWGKIYDYDLNGNVAKYNWHHDNIRHLVRSYHEFLRAIEIEDNESLDNVVKCLEKGLISKTSIIDDNLLRKSKFDNILKDNISHCILSHHGRKEWGSPVEPKISEAHILHYADMISSHCIAGTYDYCG